MLRPKRLRYRKRRAALVAAALLMMHSPALAQESGSPASATPLETIPVYVSAPTLRRLSALPSTFETAIAAASSAEARVEKHAPILGADVRSEQQPIQRAVRLIRLDGITIDGSRWNSERADWSLLRGSLALKVVPEEAAAGTTSKTIALQDTFRGDAPTRRFPPDTQLAAGSSALLQATNDHVNIWTLVRGRRTASSSFALGGVPLGTPESDHLFDVDQKRRLTDPWVTYDRFTRRWFISIQDQSQDDASSRLAIAISEPDDPTSWMTRYIRYGDDAGRFDDITHDQPKFAVTADKLVFSWTDLNNDPQGGVIAVFDKAAMVAGTGALMGLRTRADSCFRAGFPAHAYSLTEEIFVSAFIEPSRPDCNLRTPAPKNAGFGNDLIIFTVAGPAAAPAIAKTEVEVTPYADPPAIAQRSGSPLNAGDSRVYAAAWQHDTLWLGHTVSCIVSGAAPSPPDGPVAASCVRINEVATAAGFHVMADENIDVPNRQLLFPSLTIAGTDQVFGAAMQVGPSGYVGATLFTRRGKPAVWDVVTLADGAGALNCGDKDGDHTSRVGDYSSADRDPTDPSRMWVAVEIGPTGDPAGRCVQETLIASFVYR